MTRAHPFARFLPMMRPDEFERLKESIGEHGLLEPIVLYEGMILDGRNREDACEEVGKEPRRVNFDELGLDVGPLEYVRLKNNHRHLDTRQKRWSITELLKEFPERTDRWIASFAGADHKTVASIRRELEANGDIPHKAERTEESGRKARGRRREAQPEPPEVEEAKPSPELPPQEAPPPPPAPKPIKQVVVRPYTCCGESFSEMVDLQRHRQNEHPATTQAPRTVAVSEPLAEIVRSLKKVDGKDVILAEPEATKTTLIQAADEWNRISAIERNPT